MSGRYLDVGINTFGDDGLLKFAFVVELEEVSCAEGECHTLIILLKMVVDLSQDEGGQLTFGEGFIFVERLTVEWLVPGDWSSFYAILQSSVIIRE